MNLKFPNSKRVLKLLKTNIKLQNQNYEIMRMNKIELNSSKKSLQSLGAKLCLHKD